MPALLRMTVWSHPIARAIENRNGPVTAEVADRIARALNLPLPMLSQGRDDGPPAPPGSPEPSAAPVKAARKEQLLPRFDEAYARAVTDEVHLFDLMRGSCVLISHVMTALTSETSTYAEELISILNSLTWEARGPLEPIDGVEEIGLRRRIRELLVLLKGNDVWVYADSNMKRLPECFELLPEPDGCDYEAQAIIAFGAPGEYGETSIKVPIDRGRPFMLTW